MKTFFKLIAWVVGNLATVPLAFAASLHYWTAAVKEEYRTGARLSTDEDTVMIPAMEYTAVWVFFLVGLNLSLLVMWRVHRYRCSRPFKPNPLRSSAQDIRR